MWLRIVRIEGMTVRDDLSRRGSVRLAIALHGPALLCWALALALAGCAGTGSSGRLIATTSAAEAPVASLGWEDREPTRGLAAAVYRRAIAGDAVAQRRLGLMYSAGDGVPRNLAAAVDWLHRSAEQGDCAAQHNLGLIFLGGDGMPYDLDRATRWLRLAADHLGDCTS